MKTLFTFLVLIGLSTTWVVAQETSTINKIGSFNQVEFDGGAFEVFLKQGDQASLTIETENMDADEIRTEIKGNTLRVEMKNKNVNLRDSQKIVVYLVYKELRRIESSGASNFKTQSVLAGDTFTMEISGAVNTDMELDVNTLDIDLSGAGSLNMRGRAKVQRVNMSGAGSYQAYELLSEVTNIEMSGAGSAKVYASKELTANASGVGSIRYKGNPKVVNKSSAGFLSSVKPAE